MSRKREKKRDSDIATDGVMKGKNYHSCSICGMAYENEEWAVKCKDWCSEHKGSCNLDITQHAVNADK